VSYTYDKYKHYDSMLDDVKDMILLGQPIMPNFIEFTNYSLMKADVGTFKWLTSGLSEHSGEVIAGSYMSSHFNNEIKNNDVDIYFHSLEHAKLWCKINGVKMPEIQFDLCGKVIHRTRVVNVIVGVPFTDARDLIAGFDIRACAIAYDPLANKAIAVEGAVEDCQSKRIVWQVGARNVTVRRLLKYIEKGFKVDHHQNAIFVELLKIRPNRDQELLGGYK
jgi:hypothetical protein